MKKPVLAAILIAAAILGIMVYSSMNLAAHRAEVCIDFKGTTICKTARGSSRDVAVRTAIENACGEVAFGVTDSMACTRSEPTKVTVLQ